MAQRRAPPPPDLKEPEVLRGSGSPVPRGNMRSFF